MHFKRPARFGGNHKAARTFKEKKKNNSNKNESFFPPNFNVYINLDNGKRVRARNK